MTEIALPRGYVTPDRRPRLGYAMTLVAATLFAVNGAVSKVLLDTGISTLRLSELRATAGGLGLMLGLALLAPERLRLSRSEIPFLVFYGVCGFALVQWLYFVAIHRLPIGIALLLEFTAPLFVALWARFAWHERVRRRVWAALALSLTGLALVAQIWSGLALDSLGVAAGLLDAVVLAVYFLAGERGVQRRDPLSLVCYALLIAALFWAVVQPWWSFPFEDLSRPTSLHGHLTGTSVPVWPLYVWLIVLGTIVPFGLSIGALRHLPATTVGIVATFEPVAAAIVAWVWLGEVLDPSQLVGGAIVLVGHRSRRDLTLTTLTADGQRILLASPRGYCAGVERAVESVEKALDHYGSPVYVRKQIVHNIHVVRDLEARGAIFVDDESDVPEGATLVYSAHGVAPTVHENSALLNHTVIDATCPLVTKVHAQAKRYAREGYTIILIGHAGHEEVIGTMGEAPDSTVLVESAEEVETLELPPGAAGKLAYTTQTTLSVDETTEIIAALRRRFPRSVARRKRTSAMRPPTASGR